MLIEHSTAHLLESPLDRQDLIDHINTVRFLLNHASNTPNMTLYALQSLQNVRLPLIRHPDPPYTISTI
jgi:hypothetical protein